MTPEQAFETIKNLLGEMVMPVPLKDIPKVHQALSVLQEAVEPVVETKE